MKKGSATGPQVEGRHMVVRTAEPTVERRDDRARREFAYDAVRGRLVSAAERLLSACYELRVGGAASKVDELPVQLLQALEKAMVNLLLDAEQLRDTIR